MVMLVVIFVLEVYSFLRLPSTWVVKFPIVFLGSLLIVLFVNKALDIINKKYNIPLVKYLRG